MYKTKYIRPFLLTFMLCSTLAAKISIQFRSIQQRKTVPSKDIVGREG